MPGSVPQKPQPRGNSPLQLQPLAEGWYVIENCSDSWGRWVKKFIAALAIALGSAPALAAPPPAVFDWTGFYFGGHIGSGVAHGQLGNLPVGGFIFPVPTPPIDFHADGFLGGGQLGYNWQWANWVAGVEADISASHLHSNGPFSVVSGPFPAFGTATAGTAELRNDLFTTARGRLGYAFGNLLFYGTGGFAWARERSSTAGTTQGCAFGVCGPVTPFASSDTRWVAGWTAGGGIDYAFASNWFVRIEYLRLEFGKHNFAVDPALSGTPLPFASHADIARFALNYKFGSR
jgi:outer membrane immunogenic protein